MDTAAEILVIIVSVTLSIFLIGLIVLIIYAVSVLKNVKRIVERADNVAGAVQAAASAFEKTATPLAIFKLVRNVVSHTKSRKKG